MNIDERELIVEVLSSLKKFFKFKELEEILSITVPTLWRYVHGDIKPSVDRARQMLLRLLDQDIVNQLRERLLKIDNEGVIRTYDIVYNIELLSYASIDALLWAQNMGFSAVATVETDGIALATLISKRLNAKIVVIKRRKEIGYSKFIEVSYVTRSPPEVVSLYLPEDVLEYGEKVLVVDDLVRSGRTSAAVFELLKKAGTRPTGFYALVGIGDQWKPIIEKYVGSNYRVLFHVS
ncbi:phosphoribosyltransferase family protein [Ignisphaera sp. 4213-co]|uniref:Phosphoribosyltransferase family protein n=1 Tax=Ignisphaera cupida TaxID=3050454 RepID=A0ABD4Z7D0_9CREN|nr:phosphoribosyltransferase family protein [Ignisphaera sp. 4213-co]MDK6028028.1 phosphoribosyltransferase family protein [Ignisphaera sp. 4213-co]